MIWVMRWRPGSPSRASFSSDGMIAVMSWMMMDALMYGQIESVPTEQRASAPPVKRSNIPMRPAWLLTMSAIAWALTPGVGTMAMRRQSATRESVKRMRERSSLIFQILLKADMADPKIGCERKRGKHTTRPMEKQATCAPPGRVVGCRPAIRRGGPAAGAARA